MFNFHVTASMCNAFNTLRRVRKCCTGLLMLLGGLSSSLANAYTFAEYDTGTAGQALPALGINNDFGRWDSTVQLVYDPDGAPALFSDDAKMLSLLEEAIAQWQLVSGIKVVITGVDRNAPDDSDFSNAQQDGLVRVFWGSTNGFAGLAGPDFGDFDTSLGYFPYNDGDVKLNEDDSSWSDDAELVNTLVHELGHLFGLGHSDNPNSVMFANPYNSLNYPRADDIRAMQTLYGQPESFQLPDEAVAQWVYSIPPQADSAVTQFLFKANQATGNAAFFNVGSSNGIPAVSSISDATPGNTFVWLNSGGFGNHNSQQSIALSAKLVVIDPSGYLYDKRDWDLDCQAGSACFGAALTLATTDAIKTMPGVWKVLVVDESQGEANARTLLNMSLPVSSSRTYNAAPGVTLSVAAGNTASQARFTLAASDPEGDQMRVVWHPSGSFSELTDVVGNTGIVNRTLSFSLTGTHTFFVEVFDDAQIYDSSIVGSTNAGAGFRTLLKVTVNLPIDNPSTDLQVVSTDPAQPVLALEELLANVSGTEEITTVITNNGSATTARFRIGASADNGLTLADRFTVDDNVVIAGGVVASTGDVGKGAEVFVVIMTRVGNTQQWSYRDEDGIFQPWPQTIIALLEPAYRVAALDPAQGFEIYRGPLIEAIHRVFIGYRLEGTKTLHYTALPQRIDVTEP